MEKVEGKIGEALGPAQAQRFGKRVNMGDALLVRHRDLAVEHQRRQPSGSERAERLGEQFGAVTRIAAEKPDGTVGDARNQPVPVVFDLVQPTLAAGRLGRWRDNLKPDPFWQIGRDRPGGREVWMSS